MARASKTGGKKAGAKARGTAAARGRKAAKTARRPAAPKTKVTKAGKGANKGTKGRSLASVKAELARRTAELEAALQRQAASSDVLEVINASSGDLTPVFEVVLDKAMQLCRAPFGGMWVIEGDLTRSGATRNLPRPYLDFIKRQRIPHAEAFGRNIQDRPFVHVPDMAATEAYRRRVPVTVASVELGGMRSYLAVPLREGNALIGVLSLYRDEVLPFDDAEIALVRGFAAQAEIAMKNARLFNETQEALERQTATADVLKVISRSAFDLDSVMNTLAQSASELCQAEIGALYLLEGDFLVARGIALADPAQADFLRSTPRRNDSSTYIGLILAAGVIRNIADVRDEESGGLQSFAKALNFRSILFVPLMRDGRGIGVFALARAQTGQFSQRAVELVQTFADQAVIAIENTRLFNETQEALERQTATAEVLKVISRSTFDLQAVFDTLVRSAARLCEAESAFIFRHDGEVYRLQSSVGFRDDFRDFMARHPIEAGTGTLVGKTALTRDVVHIPDVLVDPDYSWTESRELGGYRTMLGVPLLREGTPVGVLAMTRDEPRPFSAKQIELVQTFADQAVIAIENTRLFNEVKARTEDLQESLRQQTATANVLKVISRSAFDLEPALIAICETAVRLCDADQSAIYTREGDLYRFSAAFGFPPAYEAAWRAAGAVPVNPSSPLPGTRCIAERRPVHVLDITAEPGYHETRSRTSEARTALGIPLLRDGEPVGNLVLNRRRVEAFTDRQIEIMQTFADQAVIAIENTRLFNETQEALARQTATADILRVISQSPTDVQPVFEAIVLTAVRLLGCDIGFILRSDGSSFLQVAGADRNGPMTTFAPTPQPVDPAANFPSRAMVQKVTYHVPDWSRIELPTREREIHDRLGVSSSIYVPMLRGGECVGVFALCGGTPNMFGAAEIVLIESFRDQAVIAIENTRLFNETQEALERQTATAEILEVIASSPSDEHPVFEAIVASANRLMAGFSSAVYRFTGDMAHLAAFTPTNPAADEVLRSTFPRPVDTLPQHERIVRCEVVHFADTESLDETELVRDIARARGFRSMLAVPLIHKGAAIGVISVTCRDPGAFADKHVQLLQTFASQAVIAIENARLFEEVQAKTRELEAALQQQTATADVLKVISRSAFDLDTVLTTLAESARAQCRATGTYIVMREGDELRFRVIAGEISGEFADMLRAARLKVRPDTLTGRAVATGEIVHIADVPNDTTLRWGAERELGEFGSGLSVPLILDGERLGAFVIGHREINAYTPDMIELVKTFADQAIIAIKNTRLFEQVQARTRELAQSLDDLRAAQDRLVQTEKLASLGQLTAGIAHEIKNPLNFVNNFAALSAELTDELQDALKPAALDATIRGEVDEITGLLRDNLGKVVQHGQRADSIVKNMLLHSREGSGDHRPTDINALVDESLNLAYHGARAEKPQFNVTLRRDFDPGAGTVEVFPQEITRVFLNLIANSFYAVTRRSDAHGAGFEPTLSAGTRDCGEHVEIRIRDNGTGIPPEVKEKMFNPFFTTKPAGEGTGLGLSMSHDIIVKQHGGTIDVDTQPGEFTEFTIRLPRQSRFRSEG